MHWDEQLALYLAVKVEPYRIWKVARMIKVTDTTALVLMMSTRVLRSVASAAWALADDMLFAFRSAIDTACMRLKQWKQNSKHPSAETTRISAMVIKRMLVAVNSLFKPASMSSLLRSLSSNKFSPKVLRVKGAAKAATSNQQ